MVSAAIKLKSRHRGIEHGFQLGIQLGIQLAIQLGSRQKIEK
jgi:hypothetical protein